MIRGLSRRSASLAGATALAIVTGTAHAAHERTFELSDFGARIESGDGRVWSIDWDAADLDAAPGQPAIPWLTLRIAVPPDQMVLDAELIPIEERVLGPSVTVGPTPRSVAGGTIPMDPDPDAFASSEWWPSGRNEVTTTGFLRGYRIVAARVAPVRFLASDGELRIAERFAVRLLTGPALDTRRALESLHPDLQAGRSASWLESRVDWIVADDASPFAESRPTRATDGPFEPTLRPSSLGSAVDMVIVTDSLFVDEFQVLADWKTSIGIRTVVRSTQWIIDTYEEPDVAARIRAFLRDAYVHWGIRFAILGGDSEIVPVRLARSYHQALDGADLVCDYYYSCLDGEWNADGDAVIGEALVDAVDLEPDIYTGRMPVSNETEAMLLVSKARWYSGADPVRFDSSYQESVSFWAEVLFWSGGGGSWPGTCNSITFDGATLSDWVYHNFMPENFKSGAHMVFEAENCWPDTAYVPVLENRSAVIADFDSGRHLVCHVGHGFRNEMAVGASTEKLTNGEADAMTNGNRLSILYAINCNSGAVDFDCIGEHFMLNDQVDGNGGAVGFVGATNLDYPATSQYHMYFFMEHAMAGSLRYLGEVFHEANRQRYAANAAAGDNAWRWTLYSLILFGDPSLDLWSGPPEAFSVPVESFHVMGSGPYRVTVWREGTSNPVEGAEVTLYKDGEVFLRGVTSAAGEAFFNIEARTPGPLTVSVDKQNFVPFRQTITVSAPSLSPYLAIDALSVDDTAGNGTGVADRGESVGVAFTVRNQGGQGATGVEIGATSPSAYVSVSPTPVSLGSIAAGAQVLSGPVAVTVAAVLPDSLDYLDVPLDLAVGSNQGSSSRRVYLRVARPRLRHIGLEVTEIGDGDGVLEPGETGELAAGVINLGEGSLLAGRLELTAVDPLLATVQVGEVAIDPAPGVPLVADPVSFTVEGVGELTFDLTYRDDVGTLLTRRVDLTPPDPPTELRANGGTGRIRVRWTLSESSDVMGYNLYRLRDGQPPLRVNQLPILAGFRTDLDLTPLTAYRYTVSAVDSSGNEGALSDTVTTSTSPPNTAGFPLDISGSVNRSSPTVLDLDREPSLHEVVFGSDYIYAIHGDGTDYLDGDAQPSTVGIFSVAGQLPGESTLLFWSKPAVADLDLDGTYEVLAVHFRTGRLLCWDAITGALEWGDATHDIGELCWSSPAVGNLDDDPELEVVLWSGSYRPTDPYKGAIVAFNHDGSEVIDGDDNPATLGVFWKSANSASEYNYGSVALADVDGDGRVEVVAGEKFAIDGVVHLFDWNASSVSELPGWPYDPPGGESQFTSAPAVADVNGDGQYEIFAVSRRALIALDVTGVPLAGYPKDYEQALSGDFNDFLPSPVIGDFNGDGQLDVVHGWHSGRLYAYTAATGVPLPGWPVTVDILGQLFNRAFFNGCLANVDADPRPEFLIGTGGGAVYAFNDDGSIVGGFPYEYGGSIFGAPAIWDIDRNGSVDLFVIGGSTVAVSLEFSGVPGLQTTTPWPQFRHDPRNSGTYGSGLGPTPIDLGSVELASTAPGRVDIRWRAVGTYQRFDIERSEGALERVVVGSVAGSAGQADRYAFTDRAAPAGRFARYWLVGQSPTGREEVGPFGVQVMGGSVRSALHQNAPNPFSPITTIAYDVGLGAGAGERTEVRLEIFDVQGRRLAVLIDEAQAPGSYRVNWDGRDARGHLLAPGLYVYRLAVGSDEFTRKLVLAH